MIRQTRHHGVASILAVVFLVLCVTLVVALYTMLSSSTGVTRNNDYRKRATWAAESGLDYLTLMLTRFSRSKDISGTSTEGLINSLHDALVDENPLSGAPRIDGSDGEVDIGWISLDANTSFSAKITGLRALSATAASPEFQIAVTGRYIAGNVVATRVIGVNADAESMASSFGGGFGIVTKGQLILPSSANGGVYLYENGKLNQDERGEKHDVEGGSVLTFGDNPKLPDSIVMPTYSQELWDKLRNYPSWNSPSGSVWRNVRITAGQTLTMPENLTIEGVLYVQYGASLTFGGNKNSNPGSVTVKGAIIWEQGPNPPTSGQSLSIGRYVEFNTPVEGRDVALQTVLGAEASSKLLNNSVVVAPQTDLSFDPGNDEDGLKTFNGNLHVRNVTSAGSGNVLKKSADTASMVINNGGILAEGNVTLKGNTAFCVNPPADSGLVADKDRYGLGIDPTTYWEE